MEKKYFHKDSIFVSFVSFLELSLLLFKKPQTNKTKQKKKDVMVLLSWFVWKLVH